MDGGIGVLLILLIMAISIATTIFWIFMMIHAAKTERWGWFVVMLVFGIVSIVYFFTEYESPSQMRAREWRASRRPRPQRRPLQW